MLRHGSDLVLCAFAFIATLALTTIVRAEEPPVSPPSEGRLEVWSGAEAFRHAWSLYGGATLAVGGGLHENGLRLRAVGGMGAYHYTSPRWTGTSVEPIRFDGTVSFAEVLVGYHHQLGPVTLKAFAGVAYLDHNINDVEAAVRGAAWGGKAVLEAWWTITDQAWASADLAWGSLHTSYGSRLRLGWRLLPELSVGPEAGAAGNIDGDRIRAGGFVRYEWTRGEVSFSGGVTHDGFDVRGDDQRGAFATLTLLSRF